MEAGISRRGIISARRRHGRMIMGSTKLAVLPVPVCAMPMMSRGAQHEQDGLGLDRRRFTVSRTPLRL